eukprot:2385434-Pleurochrysis_carterae.AAC.1
MPWLEAVRRSITRLSSRVFCSTRGSLSERSSASERPASSSCNGSRVAAREMQYARSTSSSMSLCVHETIGLAAVVTCDAQARAHAQVKGSDRQRHNMRARGTV